MWSLMKQRANPDVREVFGEVRVGLGGRRLGSGRPGAPCLLLPTAAPHIAHTPRVLQPIGGSSARSNWNRKLDSALASFVITDTFQRISWIPLQSGHNKYVKSEKWGEGMEGVKQGLLCSLNHLPQFHSRPNTLESPAKVFTVQCQNRSHMWCGHWQ